MEISGQLHSMFAFIMGTFMPLCTRSEIGWILEPFWIFDEKDNLSKSLPEIQIGSCIF